MRIIKKIFIVLLILSFVLPATIFAQVESGGSPPPPPPDPNATYEPQTTIPEPPTITPGDEIPFDLGEVYILDLKLDKTEYKSGETIRGTFNIENHSKKDSISDVYYQIALQGNYINGVAATTYDKQKYGPIFLRAQEIKPIQFAYTIPEKIGGKTNIQVQAFLKSGVPMGWDKEIITIQGESSFITITTSILQIENKVFSPHIGPPVYEKQRPILRVILSNPSSKSVTIIPNIDVYRMSALSAPLKSYIEQNFTVPAQGTKEISFDLPTFDYEPSVYTGTIALNDTDGKRIGASISFRYTIVGERVTIFSIFPSNTSFKKDETLTLRINYAGPAMDITTEKSPKIGTLPTYVKIYNEKNELAGETNLDIDFDTPGNNKEIQIKTTKPAQTSRIEAQVIKDGKVVGEYAGAMSPEEESKEGVAKQIPLFRIIITILTILLAAGALVLFRWKRGVRTMALFIAMAIPTFFVTPADSYAQYAYYNGPTSWSNGDFMGNWSPNPIPFYVNPGQKIQLSGFAYTHTCMNSLPAVRYYAEIQHPSGYKSWAWKQQNFTTENHKFADFNYDWTIDHDGGIQVPYAPGTYYISLVLQDKNGNGIMSGYYTIKVPYPPASIKYFHPSPSTINLGDSTHLYWYASNASSCSISGIASGLSASGSYPITPNVTTTYTLTCVNGDGTPSSPSQTTVTVIPIKINSFNAQPSFIAKGNSSTLSWSTTNASRCTIPSVGTFYPGAFMGVSPILDTLYSLTCYNSGGASVSASTNVKVLDIPFFAISPAEINRGQSATLTWITRNASVCTGSSQPNDSTWSGSKTVTNDSQKSQTITPPSLPPGFRNYSLTCTGPGGTPSITKSIPTPGLKVHTLLTKVMCSETSSGPFVDCGTLKVVAGSTIYLQDQSDPTPGASITNRTWTFTNGKPTTGNAQTQKVAFLQDGTQTATLVVTDSAGETETITKTFRISKPSFQEVSP